MAACGAVAADEDAFYYVPIAELKITEGDLDTDAARRAWRS